MLGICERKTHGCYLEIRCFFANDCLTVCIVQRYSNQRSSQQVALRFWEQAPYVSLLNCLSLHVLGSNAWVNWNHRSKIPSALPADYWHFEQLPNSDTV